MIPTAALIPGLSIPVLTALDGQGQLDEASQGRLLRWVGQEGQGAEIIFSGGTTGEWNRLAPATLRQLNALCHEACQEPGAPVLWAGVTALSLAETLANLAAAHALKAAAVVLAPLSIEDGPAPLELFQRHIVPLFERLGSPLDLCLYDNADIAAKKGEAHLRTADVKQLSRLDFVFGVKVSASASVIGNYLKGARHFKDRHAFGVYLGNADLSFSLMGQKPQWWAPRRERPVGVVAGPANLFPRAWRQAWHACVAGDRPRMAAFEACFEDLGAAWRFDGAGKSPSKALACMKLALAEEGVLASPRVASGTPALEAFEARAWMNSYRRIKDRLLTLRG